MIPSGLCSSLARRRLVVVVIVLAGISFQLGRFSVLLSCLLSTETRDSVTFSKLELRRIDNFEIQRQTKDQESFQQLLERHQFPQFCSRYLARTAIPPKDGLASEFQYIGRLLQTGLSTQRLLWVAPDFESAYCPENSKNDQGYGSGWTCLWKPLTNCSDFPNKGGGRIRKQKSQDGVHAASAASLWNSMSAGIIPPKLRVGSNETDENVSSLWFDPLFYSLAQRPVIPAPNSFPLSTRDSSSHRRVVDVIPHWERAYGRYWIRSQIAHWLWKPNEAMQRAIDQRLNPTFSEILHEGRHFLGIHVRFTDNIPDLAKDFGRNATITRDLQAYWEHAQIFAEEHKLQSQAQPQLMDVFVATDHSEVVEWTKRIFHGWRVWSQSSVQRSTTEERVWFAKGRSNPDAAAAMMSDLEILRRADYLVGSFQSNVFRLACQLNTAWQASEYSVHQDRHASVDLAWFEDP